MDLSYIGSVVKKGLDFASSGKLKDCFDHAYDMFYLYRHYGKDNELEIQNKLLKKILKYAYTNCEYYSNIAKGLKDKDDIKNYPFINKQVIRENYDGIVSKYKDKMIYNIARTSGSTGRPLEFFNGNGIDDYYQYQLWLKNGYVEGDKILSIMGVEISDEDVNNNIFWMETPIYKSSYGQYNLSGLYLKEDNIHLFVDYILNLKPEFIRSHSSSIYEISKYILDHNIEVDFKVKGIELTSEKSFDYQWETIRKAFNTKVFLQYGHTECCFFGYSYDDSMKVRMEPLYGYVEILDEEGNQVKEGETGEVVVTTLHNYVMPFIRYRTGDLAVYGGYDGKYLILNEIIGRRQDYLFDKDMKKILLTPILAEHHLKALGNILRWQYEQNVPGEVTIHIIKDVGYNQEDEDEIKDAFIKYGNIKCIFDYVDNIKRAPRGKSQLLIQNIKEQ